MRRLLPTQITIAAMAVVAATFIAPGVSDAARPRTGGLSGTVLGVSGAPLTGATVRAYALPGLQSGCSALTEDSLWRQVATTTTRADGTFTLPLATGSYRINATPVNLSTDSFGYWVADHAFSDRSNVTGFVQFADDVFVPTGGRSGLTLHMTTPTSVSGTFTDPDTHDPIPGLQVRGVPGGDFGGQLAMIYPSTLTDSAGHYVLRGLPSNVIDPRPSTTENEAATWGIVAVDPAAWHGIFIWWHTLIDQDNSIPDVLPVDAAAGDTIRNVEFKYMTLGGRVSGTVVNEKGRPIPGIQVTLTSAFPWPPVITDGKGRFLIPAATPPAEQPPDYTPPVMRFTDPAGKYRSSDYPGVPLDSPEATPVYAAEGQQANVTMRLLGDAPRVTGSAWYTIGQPASGALVNGTVAGCDGSFNVGGLWPGANTLQFMPAILDANPTKSLHLTLAAGQTIDVGTVYMPTWIIDGSVTDETSGDPVAGAQVDLMNVRQSDTQGDPPYFVYWADVGVPSARAVTDDGGNFRVWLPDEPLGWPQLVVRDTGNDPPRFLSQVYDHTPLADVAEDQGGDGVTDDNPWDDQGTFYDVRVAPAELDVQVLQNGEPQQDFSVQLFRLVGSSWQPVRGGQTAEDGYARFGVTPDDYRISVNDNQGHPDQYYVNVPDVGSATDVVVGNLDRQEVTVDFSPGP